MLCSIQLFASMLSSRCKHDMGTLWLLNAETLERVHTPVFGRFVRCSAHERSRYVQRDGRVSTWFERFQIGQCNLADYLAAVRHYIDLMGS